jgi:hypothetical protein
MLYHVLDYLKNENSAHSFDWPAPSVSGQLHASDVFAFGE